MNTARCLEDFAPDWQKIRADIQALKELDRDRIVHDANAHAYTFNPCLSEVEFEELERRLGVHLPPELRYVYTQVGNGGVGPDWGLERAEEFDCVRCVTERNDHGDGLLLEPREGLIDSGILWLATRYYDWGMCLVCSGPLTGSVVSRGDDGDIRLMGGSIAEVYGDWLRREHLRFEASQRLLTQSDDIEEIWRRRDQFLTEQMEDLRCPGMYSDQRWLILYIASLCGQLQRLPDESEPRLEDYVRKPEVKRAFAEMIRAHRERVRRG